MKLVSVFLAAAALGGVRAKAAAAQEPVPPHETFTLHSATLGEARRINVWTPPGYAAGRTRYAVLYMPDGGVEEDFPHVVATVDSAVRAGQMRPVIVVGIENTERRRDMTGPTTVASDSTIAPHVGGSAAFRRFIARELMPEVRRRYRVTDETAVIGESLAGLFVVETFFEQPELFDTYLALSPSLWWNHEALVRAAAGRLRAQPGLRAALYFSSASDDIGPTTARLAEIFRATAPRGLRWEYRPRPDLQHSTIYRGEAPRVLRDWLPPRDSAGRRTIRLRQAGMLDQLLPARSR
jgi:predicted alpha/beta superfamily hydrolase